MLKQNFRNTKRKKTVGKCLDSFKVQMENSRKIKRRKQKSWKVWISLSCGWKILKTQTKKKTEVRNSLDSFKVWMEVDGNAAPWLHLQDTPTAAWIEISVIFKEINSILECSMQKSAWFFYPMLPTQKSKEKVCIDNIENVFHPSSQALTSSLFSVIVLFVLNLFFVFVLNDIMRGVDSWV